MKIFYFGCWGSPGHFLWANGRRWAERSDECPFKPEHLDGSILLPRPEKVGTGALTFVRGWTVLAWWGSPWDKRPAVNCAITIKGKLEFESLWNAFVGQFPELAAHIQPPTIEESERAATQ